MDQKQQTFKHFCRICKKGFMCGRALGGHMRAHGIGDETHHADYDDSANEWVDQLGGNGSAGNKRMYALRANPNRLKSCRSCESCGQEFSSWDSFFEHGNCSSDDAGSLVLSPVSEDIHGVGQWSKRKRTMRVPSSEEEEDLANCLVMLSTARVDPPVVETESSSATAGKEEERQKDFMGVADKAKEVMKKGLFACKACKKVFSSHQALGGHRASHKKVKGCFASKLDDLDENKVEEDVITYENLSIPSKISHLPQLDYDASINHTKISKSKKHECSICHRTFASGQALGGHKRCHWVTSNSSDQQLLQRPKFNKFEPLDLNLPAPVEDPSEVRQDNYSSLHVQLPMAICIEQYIGMHSNAKNDESHNKMNINKIYSSSLHLDDEAESKIKMAKLSELKDINLGGGDSSPWLQVGIGSAANGTKDH